jgi:serine/threonine protein kinase
MPHSHNFINTMEYIRPASLNDYSVIQHLGSGTFGVVSKVIRKNDKLPFAMKTVAIGRMHETQVAAALNECRILASLRHPSIVSFEVCLTSF